MNELFMFIIYLWHGSLFSLLADFPVWPGTNFITKSLLVVKIMIPVLHGLHWNKGLDGMRFDADWHWFIHYYLVFEVV